MKYETFEEAILQHPRVLKANNMIKTLFLEETLTQQDILRISQNRTAQIAIEAFLLKIELLHLEILAGEIPEIKPHHLYDALEKAVTPVPLIALYKST